VRSATGRTRSLVVRVAASGHRVFPDDTFLRQHAVMHALAERSDVPMAHIHRAARWSAATGRSAGAAGSENI
jgi:hypothetical protein